MVLMAYPSSQTPEPNVQGADCRMDHLWDRVLGDLRDLSSVTVQKNIELAARVRELERELQVWKIARNATQDEVERSKKENDTEKMVLQQKITALEAEKSFMVYCVIDGDCNLFADHLMERGVSGGLEAARRLSDSVKECIDQMGLDCVEKKQFWVSIFFSKTSLKERLGTRHSMSVETVEQFYQGFTRDSPRFAFVNHGCQRHQTEAKVKACLESYARNPQTLKVFFVGGNSSGYFDTLSSIENEGFLNKIIILRGARNLAADLETMPLNSLKIDNLFRDRDDEENIVYSPGNGDLSINSRSRSPAPRPQTLSMASHIASIRLASASPHPTPASVTMSTSKDVYERKKAKTLNPDLPLSKQMPPPCNDHYLLGKCSKENCRYEHEYELSDKRIEELSENAKKRPCIAVLNGKECYFGDECIWGHSCPNGPSCYFFGIGKCWFKAAEFHRAAGSSGKHSPNAW